MAYLFGTQRHLALLLPLLIAFIIFFALSQGAVIWVYLSEVFPTNIRSKGQGLGSSAHWGMNAIIAFAFPVIASHSKAMPFVLFALLPAVQFLTVLFVFPETKGLSLEEMSQHLGH